MTVDPDQPTPTGRPPVTPVPTPTPDPSAYQITYVTQDTNGFHIYRLVRHSRHLVRLFSSAKPINQAVCSPDGRHIAFTLVTGKTGPIDVLHFLDPAKYLTFNIAVMNLDGSGFRQLTNDGGSLEPAWGP